MKLEKIEKWVKVHILLSIIFTAILSPIIVQLILWQLEPVPKLPDPIIFTNKEIISVNHPGVWQVDTIFSVYNSRDISLIINSKYVKIPNNLFVGESYNPSAPRVRSPSQGLPSQPFLLEIFPKETKTFQLSFPINASVEGIFPISYCILTIEKEFCSEDIYTQLNISYFNDRKLKEDY